MRVRVRDDVAKSKIVERASSRNRTKAREGLLRTATGSLQPDLPAKSSQLSLSQKDVRWQAYSDAKYYADDGVRDSCQWPQLTRHDKVDSLVKSLCRSN